MIRSHFRHLMGLSQTGKIPAATRQNDSNRRTPTTERQQQSLNCVTWGSKLLIIPLERFLDSVHDRPYPKGCFDDGSGWPGCERKRLWPKALSWSRRLPEFSAERAAQVTTRGRSESPNIWLWDKNGYPKLVALVNETKD